MTNNRNFSFFFEHVSQRRRENVHAINNLITVLSQCEHKRVKVCCDCQPGGSVVEKKGRAHPQETIAQSEPIAESRSC